MNRGKDIEGGYDPTNCPILYEGSSIYDWLIQVSVFRLFREIYSKTEAVNCMFI